MALSSALIDVAPLRSSRAFRRLWIGQSFSAFGTQMTLVAVMFQVWQSTDSTVWTGAVGLAQAVPIILFGLYTGSLVDRSERRRLYLIITVGQAASSVLLAVQGFFQHPPVIGVLLLVAVQSSFVAGGGPTARTFLSVLLTKDQVAAGLALNRIAFQAAMLLGPALGGLIVGWWGVSGCYLVDAVTFGLAFYGAFGLPTMRPESAQSWSGVREVLDGLSFLVRSPVVRGVLLSDLAARVLSMPTSLFPLINAERFGNNPRTLGLFLSAVGVGGMVASIFSGAFTRLARQGLVMLTASATWGVMLALFGVSLNPWVGLAFLVLAGAADTVAVVSRGAMVQMNTPNALLGRAAAAEQIVGRAGPDIGNMRAGLVAEATSGPVALVGGGVLCVAVVGLIAATAPGMRRFSTARAGKEPERV